MSPDDLQEIMERLERLWPASTFKSTGELDLWTEMLTPYPHELVCVALSKVASSGAYRRFRPDLPVILEHLSHDAARIARFKERDAPPDEGPLPSRDEARAALKRCREQLANAGLNA